MKKLLFILSVLSVLCSCSGDERVSRRYPCHFTFYTGLHPASMIATAMTTYNDFVRISMTTYGSAYVVNAVDRNGNSESTRLTNEYENRAFIGGIYLGAGGIYGSILFGQTNFNGLVAWDGMCPNCTTSSTNRHELQWTDNITTVRCDNCHRTYSLETGAILSGGDGDHMLFYQPSVNSSALGTVLGIGN